MKVALIVDHPTRDLPGLALVARALVKKGIHCLLVPHNLREQELWRLAPDFVLLNYYRKNLEELYSKLQAAGISVGVLDTEGGVIESYEQYKRFLATPELLRQNVACYCCWGPRLAKFLASDGYLQEKQIAITGSPRTDFFVSPYDAAVRQYYSDVEPYGKNLILLSGNFSVGNPRFINSEEQVSLLVEKLGRDETEVRELQAAELLVLSELVTLANRIAVRFPQATVVCRPHPFERIETYLQLLDSQPNLYCIQDGPIEAWLLRAKAVIQRFCSTAIEASFIGVPALSPEWFPRFIERPAVDLLTVKCEDESALMETVGSILAGSFRRSADIAANAALVHEDWFYKIDGRSHLRVAEAIFKATADIKMNTRLEECRKHYEAPRNNTVFERWDNSAKAFGIAEAAGLLKAMGDGDTTKVHRAEPGTDYILGSHQGRSLVVR